MRALALHDNQRGVMFRWGMLTAVAACALAPLCGESSMQPTRPNSAHASAVLTASQPSRMGPLALVRDPFVPQAAELPQGVVVRAVVLGTAPHALVELGGETVLVGVGDTIGGVPVVAIDDRGVRLADGTLLHFEESGL